MHLMLKIELPMQTLRDLDIDGALKIAQIKAQNKDIEMGRQFVMIVYSVIQEIDSTPYAITAGAQTDTGQSEASANGSPVDVECTRAQALPNLTQDRALSFDEHAGRYSSLDLVVESHSLLPLTHAIHQQRGARWLTLKSW